MNRIGSLIDLPDPGSDNQFFTKDDYLHAIWLIDWKSMNWKDYAKFKDSSLFYFRRTWQAFVRMKKQDQTFIPLPGFDVIDKMEYHWNGKHFKTLLYHYRDPAYFYIKLTP